MDQYQHAMISALMGQPMNDQASQMDQGLAYQQMMQNRAAASKNVIHPDQIWRGAPDRNSFMPDDIQSFRSSPWAWGEDT